MNEHLSLQTLDSLADAELGTEQLSGVNEHLAQCAACTRAALSQSLLKAHVAKAGRRYAPLDGALTRLMPRPARSSAYGGRLGWATAAALLLAMIGLQVRSGTQPGGRPMAQVVDEVADEHIAALVEGASPEVISTDRHTVKPWFQGRLPFSFNLPETLAADTKLEGANLVYLQDEPAAQLLYSIGKHRVSVFVARREKASPAYAVSIDRSGFAVRSASTAGLNLAAVSDVEPARLTQLLSAICNVQAGR